MVLRPALPQLALLGGILTLALLSKQGILPSTSSLMQSIKGLFEKHGLPLVAICSFLENIVGFNAYFPGSVAILAGMALTAGDPTRALLTYFAIVLPAGSANVLSYLSGRYLARKEEYSPDSDRTNIEHANQSWMLFLATYWHPHLAATTSFAVGIKGMLFKSYLIKFTIASLVWSAFWGLAVYHFGVFINEGRDLTILVYSYLIIWAAWDVFNAFRGKG